MASRKKQRKPKSAQVQCQHKLQCAESEHNFSIKKWSRITDVIILINRLWSLVQNYFT